MEGAAGVERIGRASWLDRLRRALGQLSISVTAAPAYPASAADLGASTMLGLRLPVRAGLAITIVTLVLLVDHAHDFLPRAAAGGRGPADMAALAVERLVLFGMVPLLTVLLVFRDDPRRYGLRLGSWRIGLGIALVAGLAIAPVVLVVAQIPEFRAYYAQSAGPLPTVVLTNTLDLVSAEFLFRGFLLFALLRVAGPIAVLAATFPFVLTHLGKPELETLSTLGGGFVFGWINWRTGSIAWSSLLHIWILTLVVMAAAQGGAT